MTWIPCGYCGSSPCQCTFRPQPLPVTVPLVPMPTAAPWQGGWIAPTPPRLSDEDIERIAKRLKELLADDKGQTGGAPQP